jgi:hypothetical protein
MISASTAGVLRRALLSIVLSSILLMPAAFAQSRPSCSSLRQYRDLELARAWDRAMIDYRLTADHRQELQKQRDDLLSDATWSMADWPALTAHVASELRGAGRLVGNLLKIDPSSGVATVTVKAGDFDVEHILAAMEKGEAIQTVVDEGFARMAAKDFVASVGPLGAGVKSVSDLAGSIGGMAYRKSQQDTLRRIVREQLDQLATRITEYETRLDASSERTDAIDAVRGAIDAWCRKYGGAEVLNGTWTTTDSARRFTLVIDGDSVSWTERAPGGRTLTRSAKLTTEGGQYRIYRPNDDEVLTFLDFQPAIRADILALHPEPSFLILTPTAESEKGGAGGLTGEWHGVIAIKDMKAKLKEIRQPREVPGKSYTFRKE